MKKILLTIIAILIFGSIANAQSSGTIPALNTWKAVAGYLTPVINTNGIKVPSLAGLNCIGTDANGIFGSGTCTGGGGVGTSTNPFMATYFVATSTTATSTFPGSVKMANGSGYPYGSPSNNEVRIGPMADYYANVDYGAGIRPPIVNIAQKIDWAGINYDMIRVRGEIHPTGAGAAFSTFDSSVTGYDSYNYGHMSAYQDRNRFNGTGTVTDMWGFMSWPEVVSGGTATNRHGVYVWDVTGTGKVDNNYGVNIKSLTRGSTANYAIYTNQPASTTNSTGSYAVYNSGTAPSYFGGNVGIGTTSPYAKLAVVGQVVSESFVATSTTATSTIGGNLEMGGNIIVGESNATVNGNPLTVMSNNRTISIGGFDCATTFVGINFSTAPTCINYSFLGDGNDTFFNAARDIYFRINNSTKMVVKSTGRVGIGTASPTGQLHVYEAHTATNTANFMSLKSEAIYNPSGNETTYANMAAWFSSGKSGANNVLDIRGLQTQAYNDGTGAVTNMAANTVYFANSGTGTVTNGYGVLIYSPYADTTTAITNAYGLYINKLNRTGITNAWGIYQANSGDSNYFAGKIGVGTTTPKGVLHITDSDTYGAFGNAFLVDFSGGNTNRTIKIFRPAQNTVALQTSTTNTGLETGASLSLQPNGGFIGIGTTSPQGILDISAGSGSTNYTTFDSSRTLSLVNTNTATNNANSLAFRTIDTNGLIATGASVMGIYSSHTANAVSGNLGFFTNNAGTISEKARITNTGYFGIGTSSPYSMLSVAGQVVASNYVATSTTATSTFAGDVTIGSGTDAFAVNYNGSTSIGTTTSSGVLNLGTNPATTNGTTTIKMGKIQFDGYNNTGGRICVYFVGTTPTAQSGACND